MSPDPHDDYYARKQAHRAEMFSALDGLGRKGSRWRPVLIAAALLIIATAAWAGWMGMFG